MPKALAEGSVPELNTLKKKMVTQKSTMPEAVTIVVRTLVFI
jgi:hypothetical protein